jgi:hypothetical protein
VSQQEATFCGPYCGLCASRRRIPQEATRLREALRREGYNQGASYPMAASESVAYEGWNPGDRPGGPRARRGATVSGSSLCTPPSEVLAGWLAGGRSSANRESHSGLEESSPHPPSHCYGKTEGRPGLVDRGAGVVSGAGCRRDLRTAGISLALQKGCLHVATRSSDD